MSHSLDSIDVGNNTPIILDRITILVSKYRTIKWDYNRLMKDNSPTNRDKRRRMIESSEYGRIEGLIIE